MVLLGQLHAAVVEDLGPLAGKLQHLVIGDLAELAGGGHDAGVRGVDPVHICEDLAEVGVEGRRQGHGAGIGAAPAQGGDIAAPVHALEARDEDDAVLVQLGAEPLRVDAADAGVRVDGGGLDAHLEGVEGHAAKAPLLQGHGAEGHADLLAGGEEHIHLPLGGLGVDLRRLGDEIVGGIPLGGEDHDDVVPREVGLGDALGHVLDTLGVLHGAAAKFLYDEAHWVFTFFLSRGGVSPGPGTGPGRAGTWPAPPGRSP